MAEQGDALFGASAVPGGQGDQSAASAGSAPSSGTSADPSADNQGGVQGGQQQPDYEQQNRQIQSIADQRLAELYRVQQENEFLRQQQLRAQPQTPEQNPYDYSADFPRWFQHEQESGRRKMRQEFIQDLTQLAQMSSQAQSESEFMKRHPDANLQSVKAFSQMRRVGDLEDAYTLMTLPARDRMLTQTTAQNVVQQFRNPQQGAAPVRGGAAATTPTRALFQDYLKAYNADPSIEERWTPEERDAFWREVSVRQVM